MKPYGLLFGLALALTMTKAVAAQSPSGEGAAATVTVTLKAQAAVGIQPITVGDVAVVAGANTAVCKVVADLDVADPLGPRGSLTVSRTQVAFRIQLAGLPAGLVRIEGEERVDVVAEHHQVTETEVLAAARRAVVKRLPSSEPDDLEITLVQPIAVPLTVTGGKDDVTLRAEVHAPGEPLGRAQVDVSVLVGGERRLSFPLYLDIHVYRQVAVLTRKVEKGEALRESAVIFERRGVEGQRAHVTSPAALAGKKARQSLNAGSLLTPGDLEADDEHSDKPLVHQRDPVKMIVHLGTVNVLAVGEAMQDGRLGQLIRVRNVDSKQVVLGRVADKSLVEIDK
jgi:flagella basal body P-ring formation protein FlgA